MKRIALCGLVCALCAATLAHGKDTRYLPDKPGFWQPQKALGEHGVGITPAEVAQIKANLERIEAVLKTTEIGANPVGFYYLPSPMWVSKGRTHPILQGLGIFPLTFMEIQEPSGWVLDMHGETTHAEYSINALDDIERGGTDVFEMKNKNIKAPLIYTQPAVKGRIGGYPVYGDRLFIARPAHPLFVQVTLREALQAAMPIYQSQSSLEDNLLAQAKQREKEFDPDAYQKKELEDFEKQWGYTKATDMRDYEEHKRQWMEPVLRQVQEIQAAAATPVRGNKNSEAYFAVKDAYANAQKWLANLTPEEAAAPACWEADDFDRGPYVIGGQIRKGSGSATCVPLVKTNPDYFDRTLSRAAVQLITVEGVSCVTFNGGSWASQRTKLSEGGCAVHAKMWQQLDWQSLAGLLVK